MISVKKEVSLTLFFIIQKNNFKTFSNNKNVDDEVWLRCPMYAKRTFVVRRLTVGPIGPCENPPGNRTPNLLMRYKRRK